MAGVVISGTGSGVGKTSVAVSLMMRMSEKMKVQPFKVGPDFIDPAYHTAATGRRSRNLDSFLMSERSIRSLTAYASAGSDICIVEGVRGLYEGSSGSGDSGSTAEIAKMLGFPVILVVDASSLNRSAAAIVNGFKAFDPSVDVAGVILNNVSGPQHERKLLEAMAAYTDVRTLGCIRKDPSKVLQQRYLGLKTVRPSERGAADALKDLTSCIDIEAVAEIADRAPAPSCEASLPYDVSDGAGLTAAVPNDDAFCFCYHDNIECMRASGVKVIEFSPAAGDRLPDADIYYLGGGYPELFASEISANTDFTEGLKTACGDGRRVVGECGGLMVMCSEIVDASGNAHRMAGIFDAEAKMTGKRHGPSYVVAESPSGRAVKGHEYHYSDVFLRRKYEYRYELSRGAGIDSGRDGIVNGRSIGTYMHQHVLSSEKWMDDLIDGL
ncbi:MAG: hydrogenobyrinic acid a,c-diamide synthase (glutamine-hydrolyzing) [Candidatus Methanoplasma sp.]|jgi:cobyrinic acid a,c-diamide synthase|nr:hydrogenobyrinic acid a,c-diamide synthase (glutamine-hydrolyzing) [Candidatus Methanoplasma sp.]